MMTEDLLRRVCGEYLEMPGLCLTPQQAQRLWGLDKPTCDEVLSFLVQAHFLCKTEHGSFARVSDGPLKVPSWQLSA